jgi:hypothetical protein
MMMNNHHFPFIDRNSNLLVFVPNGMRRLTLSRKYGGGGNVNNQRR